MRFRLNIDGREVMAYPGQSILEVATENGIEIPTLCYDEKLIRYGACGICLVEIDGSKKLFRSCSTDAAEDMIVHTKSSRVIAARKTALALLLSDHTGDCRPPCRQACPANTDCQGYVGLIANGQYEAALSVIKEQLPLPASIGRVCPHPCEEACRRGIKDEPISIAQLKSFVADVDLAGDESYLPEKEKATGYKVAIIGGGPAGLTAGYFMAKYGHDVEIFEAQDKAGGMLRYGIPYYRLPKEIVDQEIALIEKMGVKIRTKTKIGVDINFDDIVNDYDAVYISIGAWQSSPLRCPGEDVYGVIGGIEFLGRVACNEAIKVPDRVAVVGGGNTTMDACRTAIRLGAKEVFVLYRRTEKEMPASEEEIKEAYEEGANFKFLVAPVQIDSENGRVTAIHLQRMKLGAADESGRRSPVPIEGDIEVLPIDMIISTIGQRVIVDGIADIELTNKNTIHVDENTFMTSKEGVFAGGDCINQGPDIAIKAIGDAKKAADVMNSYLHGEIIPYHKERLVQRDDITKETYADIPEISREQMSCQDPEERKRNFEEIVSGYTEEQAVKEASRCLECGCLDYFECKLIKYANEYDVDPNKLKIGEVHNREEDTTHPLIARNADKCILCGLCVRVCDEVVGAGALGLINRGFDTIVKPEFEMPLEETDCISCGMCVDLCPTGALIERWQDHKFVPVDGIKTESVCGYCSIGCKTIVEHKGNIITKTTPKKDSPVNNGCLCVKGRFGNDFQLSGDRINAPLMRIGGELQEVSWEVALAEFARLTEGIIAEYGNNSFAVSVSDRLTNEEIYLASTIGREIINTNYVGCFNMRKSGLEEAISINGSTNTFEELNSTNFILYIGDDIMKVHPVLGMRLKQISDEVPICLISPSKSIAADWAEYNIVCDNDLIFLKQILVSILNYNNSTFAGIHELRDSLSDVGYSDDAEMIAEKYLASPKAMIVFDEQTVTPAAAKIIGYIALIGDHIGKAREGIIQLKPKNNSQGLVAFGIDCQTEISRSIRQGNIKGLFTIGEDLGNIKYKQPEFLAVMDTHYTETVNRADLVFPMASFIESKGMYINTERRVQFINPSIKPLCGYYNWQILIKIANALGDNLKYNKLEDIQEELILDNPEFTGLFDEDDFFWPYNHRIIRKRRVRLTKVVSGKLFTKHVLTDNTENRLIDFLIDKGIIAND